MDSATNPTNDVALIAQQESLLRFRAFNADTAWAIGSILRQKLIATNAAATVEIEVAGQLLFVCTTPGATPDQAEWIRRKRNTVRRFACSSYLMGRILARNGEDFEPRHALSLADYAAHGGGFPIVVEGVGPIGSIVLSGLPQRQDHALLVASLSELLNIPAPQLD